MPAVACRNYFSWPKGRGLLRIVMIVMTAATAQEIDGISRCLRRKQRIPNDSCSAWLSTYKDKEVLTVQTGIGRSGVEPAIESILTSYPATAILSLGFGGALIPDLGVGDLVICAAVVPWDEAVNEPANRYYADEYLVKHTIEAMDGNGLKWLQGTGVTISRLASNAKEKHGLRDNVQADVCEMEDYWVAQAASARQIPFLAVRVIYDKNNAILPDYDRMIDRRGNVRLGRTMAYFLTHPRQLFKAWASYRNCSREKVSLSAFVEKLLDIL